MQNQNLYTKALSRENHVGRVPVWFMRQAGRYHGHYQELRARHGFVDLCKKPDLACETTMGPIRDFDFDAAILFSDILFPLEALGMPLSYDPAPKLGFQIESASDLSKLKDLNDVDTTALDFQYDALVKIRAALPVERGLIGFVGAPLTMFAFAVDGSHKTGMKKTLKALDEGMFPKFCEWLLPVMRRAMIRQIDAGIDALAVFDTCAGDLAAEVYSTKILPVLGSLLDDVLQQRPKTRILYYAKGVGPTQWNMIRESKLPIQALGVDWNHNMVNVIQEYGHLWSIQGNFDPNKLRDLPNEEFKKDCEIYFKNIETLGRAALRGWVSGLGHGVLPNTPEQNVRDFIRIQREIFA